MNTFPLDVIEYCSHLAENRLFVQGKGGNVSIKVLDKMLIKASGVSMGSLSSPDTCVAVRYIDLLNDLEHKGNSIDIADYYDGPVRPSIETSFHAVIPSKVVLHLHCVICFTAMCISSQREAVVEALNEFSFAAIDYCHPGIDLAVKIDQVLKGNPSVRVFLLQNHGVIISGDSIEEVIATFHAVHERLIRITPVLHIELDKKVVDMPKMPSESQYSWAEHLEIHEMSATLAYMEFMSKCWAICPDHVLFLGANPVIVRLNEIAMMDSEHHVPFIFVPNVGVLVNRNATETHVEQLCFYLDVVRRSWKYELSCMSAEQIHYITNWEAEKYRLDKVTGTSI